MKAKLSLLILFALFLIFSSCSKKVAFTSEINSKLNLQEQDLKNLQFYVSEDIVLIKKENYGNANIKDGGLVFNNQSELDRIIIKKGTPTIVRKKVGSDILTMNFEYGNNKLLVFGNTDSQGRYYLMAEEWHNKTGKLKYGDIDYYTDGISATAYLTIKSKTLNKYVQRERKVTGVKLK